MSGQSWFDAKYGVLGPGGLGRPGGMVGGGDSGVQDGEHGCACGGFISMFGRANAIL